MDVAAIIHQESYVCYSSHSESLTFQTFLTWDRTSVVQVACWESPIVMYIPCRVMRHKTSSDHGKAKTKSIPSFTQLMHNNSSALKETRTQFILSQICVAMAWERNDMFCCRRDDVNSYRQRAKKVINQHCDKHIGGDIGQVSQGKVTDCPYRLQVLYHSQEVVKA